MAAEMILDGKLAPASHQFLSDWPEGEPGNSVALPLALWLERHAAGLPVQGVGVTLAGDDDIAALEPLLDQVAFVALHLPKFTDGRVYSHASRLRRSWGYDGLIVVFGDVLRDQLIYLTRCGVNGFYMREDQDLQACMAAFSVFAEHYQYD